MRRDLCGLLNRIGAGHVDDLHNRNPRQRILQIAMRTDGKLDATKLKRFFSAVRNAGAQ